MKEGGEGDAREWSDTLGYAVWSDDLPRVRELLSAGANPDEASQSKTALMEAVDEIELFFDSERELITTLPRTPC